MSFGCTSCGACCREAARIGVAPTNDGRACIHLEEFLDGTSRCRIYKKRPLVCRVKELRPANEDEATYYKRVAAGCDALQEKEGLGPEWRVPR